MQEKEGRMSDFDLSETVGELENMVNAAWDAGYAKGVDWAKKCGGGIDAMTDAELAERGLVRKNKEHVVSYATVEVTPHIDWSRMADEFDEFVEIVRGMAGGAE
jgi:hypothetical protein